MKKKHVRHSVFDVVVGIALALSLVACGGGATSYGTARNNEATTDVTNILTTSQPHTDGHRVLAGEI